MAFTKGHAKQGGKKKGSKHKKPHVSFASAKESCERLGCNPADFLAALVLGDRAFLGLSSRAKVELRERRQAAQFLLSRLEHIPDVIDPLHEELRKAQLDYIKAKTAELVVIPTSSDADITIEVID